MSSSAEEIAEILQDYGSDHGVKITVGLVNKWGNQFKSDSDFVLSEISHILKEYYISKERAKQLLSKLVPDVMKLWKYSNINNFFQDTEFLDVQSSGKSQKVLLTMLFEIIQRDYGIDVRVYSSNPKVNYIYIDDLLCTGGTIKNDLKDWLPEKQNSVSNLERIVEDKAKLLVYCFGYHEFSKTKLVWGLKAIFNNDARLVSRLTFLAPVVIEDNTGAHGQKHNCLIPCESSIDDECKSYLQRLPAEGQPGRAYRLCTQPNVEMFYTSKASRERIENIFVKMGIMILDQVTDLKPNQRPLGQTYPSYKTFGTGTMMFTWRNISNTCPIVFWWDNHGWQPLFPLFNRGLSN